MKVLEDGKMKKLCVLLIVCLMSVAAQAVLFIDDFADTSLAEYTLSVVNQNSTDNAAVSFASPSGALQVSKGASTANKAEQVLFLRDEDLGVGEILRVDKQAVTMRGTANFYADFGIAICYTADPPDKTPNISQDVRRDMVAIYLKSTYSNIGYCAYDTATGIASIGSSSGIWGGTDAEKDALYAATTGLFISRTSLTTVDIGYSTATGDTVAKTLTFTNTDIGNAVGFWGDMRYPDTTYGDLDNLRIVPEPATMLLLGIGSILALRRRK
jgi:hypothetical protein